MKKLSISLFLIFLLIVSPCFATTATFQQGISGYSGAKGSILSVASTNENITGESGVLGMRSSNGRYIIFYFDVSSIPTTATVSSAIFDVKAQEVSNCSSEDINIKSIENPDNSGSFDMPATEGSTFNDYATYLYKNHGSLIDWDSSASNDFLDVDDNSIADTETALGCPGSYSTLSFSVTDMVGGWVSSPNSNAGLFLYCNDGSCGVNFLNQFTATATDRPKLTVEFSDAQNETSTTVILKNIIIKNAVIP